MFLSSSKKISFLVDRCSVKIPYSERRQKILGGYVLEFRANFMNRAKIKFLNSLFFLSVVFGFIEIFGTILWPELEGGKAA